MVLEDVIVVSFFFFFFQAEDGIRDADVSGVQTCALPIFEILEDRLNRTFLYKECRNGQEKEIGKVSVTLFNNKGKPDIEIDDSRSEERRVGKECRYRWAL